jgi:hypothetical protein
MAGNPAMAVAFSAVWMKRLRVSGKSVPESAARTRGLSTSNHKLQTAKITKGVVAFI